ncbi:MAG: T9SS type A sorting domain-containing protein [Chitinophagales bacterium]|nr:T9SS type A sorting domain-containing protein [Bacteroidota bacterium]MBP7398365.1 T9SS type A sorting domain-containing protein [Chitinophagales bacterium]MBP8753110.1 T9SS type A sorting domain-containing protein [Chitinophagales bacterium]
MRKIILSILTLCFFYPAFAQKTTFNKSDIFSIPKAGVSDPSKFQPDFFTTMYSLEMPAPGSGSYRSFLIALKETLYANKIFPGKSNFRSSAFVPIPDTLTSFEGNTMGSSVPNDNDIAISNGGMIVSVINTSIYIFDQSGSTLASFSLETFSDTLEITGDKFDPKVMYDPVHDRFIIVFLNLVFGDEANNTDIIVAFSQTNNPLDNWNLYSLPGNPKDNDTWTDFPMLAITQHELFITGNSIIPGEPWQTGFSETLIWQMNLDSGYSGADLSAVFWDDILYEGNPIRNLCPVKGGSTTYGPNMYLLSNRNFAETNDTIFIVEITGTLDDVATIAEINFSLSDVNYAVPPQARQYNSHTFDTNDGRILGAVMENGWIQFVANTLDPATGFSGIYHGMITDLDGDNNITGHIIGDDSLDFGYPNISYSGRFENDDQCIIVMNHSSPEVYAGMSAFFYNQGEYSERLHLKSGETYVNVISGYYERWGDYTGSQRKYNAPGNVWVSGTYGKLKDLGPFTNRNNATWISNLRTNDSLPPVSLNAIEILRDVNVFPNPADTYFETTFYLSQSGKVECSIYDMQGKLMKTLITRNAPAGETRLTFSTEPLQSGTYILKITLNDVPLVSKQFVRL